MLSFCGPCRLNVESMNHSIVLVLLWKGVILFEEIGLKGKTFEHACLYFFVLFSTVFIYCFATFRGYISLHYSSIPVIQIFVTKNTFALFPYLVSILFTVSQLNCVSIRETYTHPVFRPQTRRHSLMYLSFQ